MASPNNSRNSPPCEGKEVLKSPIGYRFYPSNDEVIDHLKKKILGKFSPDIIPTIDVYSHNPDQLPLDEFKYGVAGEWFFFTTRAAGKLLTTTDGYWRPTGLPTEVDLDDRIIGSKEAVDFYWGRLPNGTKSNWTIHEYRLNPDELEAGLVGKAKNFVVCRVRDIEKFQLTHEGIQQGSGSFSSDEVGFLTSSGTDDDTERWKSCRWS